MVERLTESKEQGKRPKLIQFENVVIRCGSLKIKGVTFDVLSILPRIDRVLAWSVEDIDGNFLRAEVGVISFQEALNGYEVEVEGEFVGGNE